MTLGPVVLSCYKDAKVVCNLSTAVGMEKLGAHSLVPSPAAKFSKADQITLAQLTDEGLKTLLRHAGLPHVGASRQLQLSRLVSLSGVHHVTDEVKALSLAPAEDAPATAASAEIDPPVSPPPAKRSRTAAPGGLSEKEREEFASKKKEEMQHELKELKQSSYSQLSKGALFLKLLEARKELSHDLKEQLRYVPVVPPSLTHESFTQSVPGYVPAGGTHSAY